MPGRAFAHGFDIYMEKATLTYHSAGQPLTLLTKDGKTKQPVLSGGGDPLFAFTKEIQAAVNGVVKGIEPDLLSGALARDALVLCHKEIQSVNSEKVVIVG